MKKALIFGISGFVGDYLAKELINNGYEVTGSDVSDFNGMSDIDFFKADLLNAEEITNLVLKIKPEVIFNLAAISSVGLSWKIPQATMSVNITGALNIMEAARSCETAPRIMLVGSSEEYAPSDSPISESSALDSNNPYGISKLTQEKFAEIYRQRYGMKIYCVRPFNHTGVGQKETFVLPSFCKQAAEIEKSGKDGVIRVGNLEAKRDFSDVRDIVRAYRMIIESDDCSKVYNIGSGNAYSLREMLDYIISLGSRKITVEIDPERFRPVDTPYICCDNSLIKDSLGWKPEFEIFDTLKAMVENFLVK